MGTRKKANPDNSTPPKVEDPKLPDAAKQEVDKADRLPQGEPAKPLPKGVQKEERPETQKVANKAHAFKPVSKGPKPRTTKKVYGNKDKNKEYPFLVDESGFYHVRTSRSFRTPSGTVMEDPGSIRLQAVRPEQFDFHLNAKSYEKQGLTVEIVHDPTLEGDLEYAN